MNSDKPLFKITNAELALFELKAADFLSEVEWQSKSTTEKRDKNEIMDNLEELFELVTNEDMQTPVKISFMDKIMDAKSKISENSVSVPVGLNQLMSSVEVGIQLSLFISEKFTHVSKMKSLENVSERASDYELMQEVQSIISMFVLSSYVIWSLKQYQPEEVEQTRLHFAGIPEISYENETDSLNCQLYYFSKYLEVDKQLRNEKDFVKLGLLYFENLLLKIIHHKEALSANSLANEYFDYFNKVSYELDNTDFTLHGFDIGAIGSVKNSVFKKVEIEEVKGNREAKLRLIRTGMMLLAYDFKTQSNVFMKYGSLHVAELFDGLPGGGKGMLAKMFITWLAEKCEWLGYNFKYLDIGPDIVSKYQGETSIKGDRILKQILYDPKSICFGTLDEGENLLADISNDQISAGIKSFRGVWLKNLDGIGSVHRGNAALHVYTNYPEQMDSAAMSRFGRVTNVPGPETVEDIMDMTMDWLKVFDGIDSKYLKMNKPNGYVYNDTQKLLTSLNEGETDIEKIIQEPILKEFYLANKERWDPTELRSSGEAFIEAKKIEASLSGRDYTSIRNNAALRVLDVTPPESWLKDLNEFYHLDSEKKDRKVVELIEQNKTHVGEYIFQEMFRLIDNRIRVNSQAEKRKIAERVEFYKIDKAAREQAGIK